MKDYIAKTLNYARQELTLCAALYCLLLVTPAAFADSSSNTGLNFLSWWEGDYDNARQVAEQLAGPNPEKANTRQRLFIRRVNQPAFGDNVFYAEWQDYDDTSKIMRQRFYAMEEEGNVQRLNLHIFPTDDAFVARTSGAHMDPSKLDGVTPADMVPLKGCDVYFEWDGASFSGAMEKRACAFPAPGDGVPIYSWSQMRLEPESFLYLDGWFREDDSVYMQLANHWYVFEKQPEVVN